MGMIPGFKKKVTVTHLSKYEQAKVRLDGFHDSVLSLRQLHNELGTVVDTCVYEEAYQTQQEVLFNLQATGFASSITQINKIISTFQHVIDNQIVRAEGMLSNRESHKGRSIAALSQGQEQKQEQEQEQKQKQEQEQKQKQKQEQEQKQKQEQKLHGFFSACINLFKQIDAGILSKTNEKLLDNTKVSFSKFRLSGLDEDSVDENLKEIHGIFETLKAVKESEENPPQYADIMRGRSHQQVSIFSLRGGMGKSSGSARSDVVAVVGDDKENHCDVANTLGHQYKTISLL
jgi:hypothetical protein